MNEQLKYNKVIALVALYDIDSLPLCTLHAVLRRTGFNVISLFFKKINANNTMTFPTDAEMDRLVEEVKAIRPLFVGISVRSTHFKLVAELSRRIKKETGTLIVWGGIHPTIRPAQSIEHADIVCVGEGDEAIVELASRLYLNEPIDAIQNLWIRKGDAVIKNQIRPLIQDLDSLPFPDFTHDSKCLLEDGARKSYPSSLQKENYFIMASRGCPKGCAYCCNSALKKVYQGKGPYVRRRSVDNVIAELKEAKRIYAKCSFVSFWDDVFITNDEWLRDFAVKYKEQIRLPFFCYCYPSSVTEPILRILKDAGVAQMTMGIQTGSQRTRSKHYGRHESNDTIVSAAQLLNRFEINCAYDIILDSPIESETDRQMTFDLVASLPRPFILHTHTLTHFPETDLTKMLLEKQLITSSEVEDQKQLSYERWTPQLDLDRDKENLYWDCLYFLFGIKMVPTRMILWISRIKLFKRYPQLLVRGLITVRAFQPILYNFLRVPRWFRCKLQERVS